MWKLSATDILPYEHFMNKSDVGNGFTWAEAKAAGVACDRHPYLGARTAACSETRCVICHKYKQGREGARDGWAWSDNQAMELLNN